MKSKNIKIEIKNEKVNIKIEISENN